MTIGQIYLTQNPNAILESLQIPKHQLRVFQTQDFQITHAHEVINEAYIADDQLKTIAIIANSFNLQSQNALLKILEEPPHNTRFLIFTPNKNALIPTIRSRMMLTRESHSTPLTPLDLNLKSLNFQQILDFLKPLNSYTSRQEGQMLIQRLLYTAHTQHITLTQTELDLFDKAIQANTHYEKITLTLTPLLLAFLQKTRKR
ncbi:hypothetical protein BBW65_06845 [Helicobacter enhydrae]|uniref:DNA polymerase III subunit delta n=1 Tax=Helicobacter enhydrae TaxID=222136 RepID=A0A1B1U6Y8_9HELI|nr:DNA polymerase III subunit delta' [Helicobacter enhydrae]ANV98528.1 hypothetical protein BBW65_06845 [Helicobacter enhydrae]